MNSTETVTSIEELLGTKLVNSKGEEVSTMATLGAKKQIVLYFSAHWCPPCRGFTPILSKAYHDYQAKIRLKNTVSEMELLFVSSDGDQKAFDEYHKEMTFHALLFDNDRNNRLMEKYGIDGIPSLVAIDCNGDIVPQDHNEVDFRSLISVYGAEAFPLTREHLQVLKAEEEKRAKECLKALFEGQIPFQAENTADGNKLSFRDLFEKSENICFLFGDGDTNDTCYSAISDVLEQVRKNTVNKCLVVYLGWSFYESDSDHKTLSKKFDYSINEVSEQLRSSMQTVVGEAETGTPLLAVLRMGSGLCALNGKCEDKSIPVLVSTDPGLQNSLVAGADAFPWDSTAMKAFEEGKKARIEKLKSDMVDFKFLTEIKGENIVLSQHPSSSLKEKLHIGDKNAVIGLYFSAHWCPPCQRFTPELVKCYEQVRALGEKFEIIFVSSDSSREEFEDYYSSMVTGSGNKFLALDYEQRELKTMLSEVFNISGIPSLVLLKSDGSLITKLGTNGVQVGGAAAYPWDDASVDRVKNELKEAALKKEKQDEERQLAAGEALVKRLIGCPGSVNHIVEEKLMTFKDFSTFGVPDMLATTGIIYYELEIKRDDGGVPQFGFSLKDGLKFSDDYAYEGVGDNDGSWAVDGARSLKWHGEDSEWMVSWKVGDTIGLAANVDKGMIAVSKNGIWEGDALGVVFTNTLIREGVYPCFSAGLAELKYEMKKTGMKHGLPPERIWTDSDFDTLDKAQL